MKKVLLLAIVALFIATISQAQISKGSVLLGGNIGFGNSKDAGNGYYKHNYFGISPVVGVAVKTNTVAGIAFAYVHQKYLSDSVSVPQNTTSTGGGIFLRRYFPVAKNFYLYGEGDLGYSHYHSKEEGVDFSREQKSNTVSLDVSPGLAYAISRKFHLEMGLSNLLDISYTTNKIETSDFGGEKTVKGHAFGLSTSLSTTAGFYIGFRVFLSK